jgi:hypothetical protein
MNIKKSVLLLFICIFVGGTCSGSQKKMIALLKDASNPGYFPAFKEFGVETILYDKKKLENKGLEIFIGDLENANVLAITNKSKDAWRIIADNDDCRKALRKFLRRGGTVFCDYKSAGNGNGFLYCLGAIGLPWTDSSCSVFADGKAYDEKSPLADVPEVYRGHGGWIKYIHPFKKLVVMKEKPEAAMLLMQENVNGKGRIIYSLLIDFLLWNKSEKMREKRKKNVEALLNLIFNNKG